MGREISVSQNSDTQTFGRTDDIVSEKLGIGSRDTYRKEKYIVDNADSTTLSQWEVAYFVLPYNNAIELL